MEFPVSRTAALLTIFGITASGLIAWLALRARLLQALIRDRDKEIASLKTALADTKSSLRDMQSRANTIIDSIQTGIIITDPDTHLIIDVNPMGCAMIGAPQEAITGQPSSRFIPGVDNLNEPVERAECLLQPITPQKPRSILITIRPVTLNARNVLLKSFVDITEHKDTEAELRKHREHLEELIRERTAELCQTNEELQRSNKELETFAYVASHDLQEPLRLVGTHTQLLMLRYHDKLDAEAEPITNTILEGVNRMRMLIHDLLAYSRVGARSREIRDTDCEKVLARVVTTLSVAIAETGATIEHDPLPVVRGDPTRLEQLFQNLIGNAIKFRGKEPSRVHISARKKENDSEWLFVVEDNGIGIEPAYFDRIFVIFQRLHNRNKYNGTGIGLAICKRIVEQHGGQIWVESEPGHGSRFYFTLVNSSATSCKQLP